MVKMGDDVADDDDDDEGRTIVSQNQVTAKLCNKELFLRTRNKYVVLPTYQTGKNMGGGRKWTINTTLGYVPARFTLPSQPFMQYNRVYNVH